MDEITGNGQGAAMEFLLGGNNQLEDDLVIMQDRENKDFHKLAGLQGADGEEPAKVLQTYTVPLQEVRKDLEAWREAMMDEYRSLVNTEVVKPIDECDLAAVPGIEDAKYAPGKLLTTIKAATGRKRARAVLVDGNGKVARTSADKAENYAGGIDGTLRCVLRKGAHEQWSLATVDVKCAFLLAPRKETRRTLITRPPKVLVEAGIVKASERWLVQAHCPDRIHFLDVRASRPKIGAT